MFELDLMENLVELHNDLIKGKYNHGSYVSFRVNYPKPRHIHKASIRDRLLHHAIHRILYPEFDKKFISDSYSCRINKGTHKAIKRFEIFSKKASLNNIRTCWVLKCDIKKFFDSIDHEILISILNKNISDEKVVKLLEKIIESFHKCSNKGLPLGNLTSQLLVNIYINEFDHFVKHELRIKYYIRYADDFVVLSPDRGYLEEIFPIIESFLNSTLKLSIHPNKISINTMASGIDFLGWVHFPDHCVLRTSTKRRMLKNITKPYVKDEVMQSYLGLLSHGNTFKLQKEVRSLVSTQNLP
ncbi:MAG: reverse transcriptase/maturase family protein [Candidatus Pacebacteria bacterium]|nr:reverse transcriptase/maturase family protein [Candidatus Paceibacterota bacterium]